jgi:ABC-2 type transport system ATP-binding protein
VFLDELTTGLDPQARRAIWDLVRGIRERGKTVFMTTHLMEEAERLCDRVVIIDHGRVLAEGDMAALSARFPAGPDGKPARLEDVFLALTGRGLRDE